MELKNSETYKNLAKAYSAECQARTRYEFVEYGFRYNGYEAIAQIIDTIAYQEFNHARMLYTQIQDGNQEEIKNIDIQDLKNVIENYDIIINTVPALIIDEELLHYISPTSYILDIASYPGGGVDYKKAKEYGVNAFLLPSLPTKCAPKSSGIAYAKAIERGVDK